MESSILSVNPDLYGDYHNMGHVVLSYVHDPDHRHLESFGVVGDSSTAMRGTVLIVYNLLQLPNRLLFIFFIDPVFYRFHQYCDDLFQEHKTRLTPYTVQQLGYNNVQVNDVQVQQNGQTGTLTTFWQQSDVDFSRGMDFVPRGSVFARYVYFYTGFNQIKNNNLWY